MTAPNKTRPGAVRGWRIALGAVLLLVVGLGLSRISFNVDILRLLPTGLRQVQGLQRFLKYFSQPDELILTVEAKDPRAAQRAADDLAAKLTALPQIVKRAVARPPWEKDPGQLVELLAFLTINQPPEAVRDLLARTSPERTAATLQDTLERLSESASPQEVGLLSYDPFDLAGPLAASALASGAEPSEFASADGTFHLVYVQAARPFANYQDAGRWLAEIHRAVAPWQGREGVALGFTGEPAFVASISSSMQGDMQSSGLVTLLVIALLFYACYRRGWPLLELQGMLLLTFVVTLAVAGLCFRQLTVIGVGCAAILIGLCVDYGYFIYQRSQRHTGTLRELQRQCLSYIAWTAGTTAAAFFALNVSSLPGLSQLGNLVGVGVLVGSVVMLTIFAPLTLRRHQKEPCRAGAPPAAKDGCGLLLAPAPASSSSASPVSAAGAPALQPDNAVERLIVSPGFNRVGAWATLAVVAILLAALLVKGPPGTDFSPTPLRPRHSEAYAAIDRLAQKLLDGEGEPLSLVVEGGDVETVRRRLVSAEAQLEPLRQRGVVRRFRTALPLWPNAGNQRANLLLLRALSEQSPRLRQATLDAGFQPEAFGLTENVLRQAALWSREPPPVWPGNDASRWILRRLARHADDGKWYALGFVQPEPRQEARLDGVVAGEGIYLTGWPLLTAELREVIPREFAFAVAGIAAVVLGLLALAFREAKALGLFVGATALVLGCLLGAMALLGLRWNVFNLAALLLLMGTGTDYSILLLLALRRNGGDVRAARREIALVVCLCAASASAGFGTISWANHAGLASLGQTCALGLLIDAAVSVFLLPPAWAWLHRAKARVAGL